MAQNQLFIGSYRRQIGVITAAMGTAAEVVWKPGAAGSRIHAIFATSRASAATTVGLNFGQAITKQDATNTGAMAFTTNTITRASGSFITDGWLTDMRICVPEATTLANRKIFTITAATATTLTFAASSFTAEALPAGASLLSITAAATVSVPANAGNVTSTPPVNLMSNLLLPYQAAIPDCNEVMGPNDWLVIAASAALTSPATLETMAVGGDY